MERGRLLVLVVALGAACSPDEPAAVAPACPPIELPPAPDLSAARASNLILISIDTLRRDALGRYEGQGTPFLDDLASRSLVLDDHASNAAWTFPSMTCALGGRCPEDLGFLPDPYALQGLGDAPVLATWLDDAGFVSATVTASLLIDRDRGLAREVDVLEVLPQEPAEVVLDHALTQLDALRADGRRWVLHAHLTDSHSPYEPPDRYAYLWDDLAPLPVDLDDPRSWSALATAYRSYDDATKLLIQQHFSARYEGAASYTDAELGRFWEALQARGALDDTVVVVFSDHGEQLWEHGRWGHGISLHYGERAAIAMIWAPGLEPLAWPGPTDHMDLVPTLLPMLGLPVPPEVTGVAVGAADPDAPRFAVTLPDERWPLQAVDWQCYTMLYAWHGGAEVYRRDVDPRERHDRSDAWAVTAALWDLLEPEVRRVEPMVDGPSPVPVNAP